VSRRHNGEKIEPQPAAKIEPATMAYMDIFGEAMMQETPAIRACGDHGRDEGGNGTGGLQRKISRTLFDVGIAEGHAVTLRGMAASGCDRWRHLFDIFAARI